MAIACEIDGDVAYIGLQRSEALNALSFELLHELGEALDRVRNSSASGLVVFGEGAKAFCAGADVKELAGRSPEAERQGIALGQATFSMIEALPIPSVAVIHGLALGGGLELAMACTFRVATPAAKMGLPEIKLGLIPGYGGTQRLPRLVGVARATEIVLSGRTLDADEALRIGLVNEIVAPGDPAAIGRTYLSRFEGLSRQAIALARRALAAVSAGTIEQGLRVEADMVGEAFRSEDGREGMQAFIDRRKPVFIHR